MNKIKSLKNIFHTSGTKHGAYSVGLTVLVIAVVIVFNLIVGQIPEAYRNLDVSSTKIYDISDTTTELLDSLDSEVDMTVLAVKDSTDERITNFLSRYAALSDKIKVEWIDPVLHPSALTEYDTTEDTIVISCEDTGKTTTVSFDDILVMDQYSYYYYGTTSYTEFDGEGQLTGAVNYVTNDTDHTIYQTTGHGESSLSTTITDLMEISEDEAQMLRDYLAGGGKVMILSGDANPAELPNLAGVLREYGIEAADGYIADPSRCYQGNYYYIFPELSVSGDMASGISSEMVLLTNAHGMNLVDPERDTISTTSFMSSSDQAYTVTEDTQEQGSYTLGAVATETIESTDEDETESRLTVISAGSLIDQSITDTFPQLENTQIFMNAVTANFEGVQNLSIEAKSLGTEYNTMQHIGLLSFLVIFGIPAVILIGGFVVWFRRRRA